MVILGIAFSHDGTLSVVRDGVNVYSIGEERLNRRKSYIGFPFNALRFVIEQGIIKANEIDMVAVPLEKYFKKSAETFAFVLTENKTYYDLQNEEKPSNYFVDDHDWEKITTDEDCKRYVEKKLSVLLGHFDINAPIVFIDHHLSHAASAYYASGQSVALAITMDGEGDLLSATVNTCRNGKIERISATDRYHSAGYLYSAVTRKCGFKVSRHEGKITGLAAYGNHTTSEPCFAEQVKVIDGRLQFSNLSGTKFRHRVYRRLSSYLGVEYVDGIDEILERCGNLANADLAASVQNLLEIRICEIVRYWIEKTGISDVVLAGGVFANVKFNQRIAELDCVDSIFIYPDMGDGGAAYGAAAVKYFESHKYTPEKLMIENVYYGPEYSNDDIEAILKKSPNIRYTAVGDICRHVAELIAYGKIVGWFQGRMEYGPRALGNRSILASPTDATINKWLNDRLNRTEFMPFAPSCLYEFADEIFDIKKEKLKLPAEFMTITYSMKKDWIEKAPAVAHIDGTARPQLVRRQANPKYYQLLREYYHITGLPLFINTSFNVHEEPIVCSPEDAIKPLLSGVIDCLAINDFVCTLA